MLIDVKEWDLSFLTALDESCLFLPLISEAAISNITKLKDNQQVAMLAIHKDALEC